MRIPQLRRDLSNIENSTKYNLISHIQKPPRTTISYSPFHEERRRTFYEHAEYNNGVLRCYFLATGHTFRKKSIKAATTDNSLRRVRLWPTIRLTPARPSQRRRDIPYLWSRQEGHERSQTIWQRPQSPRTIHSQNAEIYFNWAKGLISTCLLAALSDRLCRYFARRQPPTRMVLDQRCLRSPRLPEEPEERSPRSHPWWCDFLRQPKSS